MIPVVFFAGAAACAVKATFAMQRGAWGQVLLCVALGVVCAFFAVQTLPTAFG